jgi:peptide/nickel transport system permease protein
MEKAVEGMQVLPSRRTVLTESIDEWQRTSSSPGKLALIRLYKNKGAVFGLICFLLLVAVVSLAPLLAPFDPTAVDGDAVMKGPNARHLFGTDDLGRDVFSRVLWGGRESIRVGSLAVLVAIIGGSIVGTIPPYFGGWFDTVTQRIVEVFLSFPPVLLLLSIVATLGPGLTTVLIAIGLADIPFYSRMVRSSVLGVKNEEYIASAQVIGASHQRIMLRYILPNMLGPIIIYGTMEFGWAIILTAGLSYIGLGAQPPSPEWGAMLNYGRSYLRNAWWMSVFPGFVLFLAVLSINLLGDGLRDALDPKTRLR